MIILLTGATAPTVAADFSTGADATVESHTPAQPAAQSGAIPERELNVAYSYAWDGKRTARVDDKFVPSDRPDSKQTLKWIVQLLLLLVPVVLGLTLVLTSLRKDVRSRRAVPYRQRGPHAARDRGNEVAARLATDSDSDD